MTDAQELHLAEIKTRFCTYVDQKYRKGQAEHGGNLWENSAEQILNFAIEEAIDQVTYLLTLRDKMRTEKLEMRYKRGEHL